MPRKLTNTTMDSDTSSLEVPSFNMEVEQEPDPDIIRLANRFTDGFYSLYGKSDIFSNLID